MKAIYKKRLLKCADIIAKAKPRAFTMERYFHKCGSPGCVLGHYQAATKVFGKNMDDSKMIQVDTTGHFGISVDEESELFSWYGCNYAKTPKAAAKYIRQFVKRKELEKR
jgi:hypothetical protein